MNSHLKSNMRSQREMHKGSGDKRRKHLRLSGELREVSPGNNI